MSQEEIFQIPEIIIENSSKSITPKLEISPEIKEQIIEPEPNITQKSSDLHPISPKEQTESISSKEQTKPILSKEQTKPISKKKQNKSISPKEQNIPIFDQIITDTPNHNYKKRKTTNQQKSLQTDENDIENHLDDLPKKRKKPAVSASVMIEAKTSKSRRVLKRTDISMPMTKAHNNRQLKNLFDTSIYQTENKIPGNIYVMGQGDAGQLGLGPDMVEVETPKLVKVDANTLFTQVVCGGMHTLILSQKGVVYSTGCNDEGALGRLTPKDDEEYTFKPISLPKKMTVIKISCGDSHSVLLNSTGSVYAWGTFRDSKGPIGLIKAGKFEIRPTVIYHDISDVCVDICSGSNHIMILTKSGCVFTCGCGDEGQLGRVPVGITENRGGRRGVNHLTMPKEVFVVNQAHSYVRKDPLSYRVVRISASKYSSFAFLKNGTLYGWGLNNYNQLGSKYYTKESFPVLLEQLVKNCSQFNNANDLTIAGGCLHILVLNTKNNVIYSIGDSSYGRLGRKGLDIPNNPDDITSPSEYIKPIELVGANVKFEAIGCGDACSFAITSDKHLYSWGIGTNLQLGSGSDQDILTPTLVSSECISTTNVIHVSSGSQHTAILCSM